MAYLDELLEKLQKQRSSPVQQAATDKMLDESRELKTPIKAPETFKTESKPASPLENSFDRERASYCNRLNYKDAIFRIFAPQTKGENVGSGFFYSANGYFLTDLHVVGDAKTCRVETNDGQQLTAMVDTRNPENDLAIGHVVDQKTRLRHLIIDNTQSLTEYKGATFAAGYAYGGELQLIPGNFGKIVMAATVIDGDLEIGENPRRQVIVTDNFAAPAMSGGVIFDKDFLPIGVIDKGDIRNYGKASKTISTPISDCLKLIKQLKSYQLDSKF